VIPLVWVRGDEWRTPSRLDQVILPCVLGALYTIGVCIVISRCAADSAACIKTHMALGLSPTPRVNLLACRTVINKTIAMI